MVQQSIAHLRSLCNITDNHMWKLKHDSVERVERVETNTTLAAQYKGQYTERQTPYMIKLRGEKRLRRVYATPIGNVSSMYFKVYNTAVLGGVVYCELALDEALHRAE
jgi:hypothetical protein